MHIDTNRKLNVLITGGRAPVALELARQFAAAGHRVFAADSVQYYLCRVSNAVTRSFRVPKPAADPRAFIHALRSIIVEQKIDLLLPTCEELYYIALGKEAIRLNCHVFCESIDRLDQLHNKMTFIELAASLNFNVPYTRLLTDESQLSELQHDTRIGDHVVLKPVYSRFAANVQIMRTAEAYHDAKYGPVSASSPWVAQQFISGRSLSTYSIAHKGGLTAHAAYAPAFTAGRGAGIYFEPLEHIPSYRWVQQFVRDLNFTGQIAFDFIEADDGTLYPIECNPRATSGVHILATDDGALANAIVHDARDNAAPLLPPASRPPTKLALAMLAYGVRFFAHPSQWNKWWKAFVQSRDVIYRRHDHKPFLEQLRIVQEAWHTARALNLTLLQAATADIEWNGER